MTSINFEALGPNDYDRAKSVLNKAKHPGFVGRELFFRCATGGTATLAVIDDIDAGIALIVKDKLQALSVITSMQGRGVGQALMARMQPQWVQAISEKVAWFEKIGYVPFGPAKVGQNGKHAVQLMQRASDANSEIEIKPAQASEIAPENVDPIPTFRDMLFVVADERADAELAILDGLLAKAVSAEKFEAALKIMGEARKLVARYGMR